MSSVHEASTQDHDSSDDLDELRSFSDELGEMAVEIEDDATAEHLIRIAGGLRRIARRLDEAPSPARD